MAAHRWIVCFAALALSACAARVQPKIDTGLAAGWQDGPKVGGHLDLGKYEGTLAAPPLAGPVPPLSLENAPASPPPPASSAAVPADVGAGQDSCAGGACVLPPAGPPSGPTAAPAPADAGGGGFPVVPVLVGAGLLAAVYVVARAGKAKS